MAADTISIKLATLEDTKRLAASLAAHISAPSTIWLQGQLGVGKTALCRSFIQTFDAGARVKSPTYTIVESYPFPQHTIHHFDFYRIAEASELENIGIRDYFQGHNICLMEWPENAHSIVPSPDLTIGIDYGQDGETSRRVILECSAGGKLVDKLGNIIENIHKEF